VTSNAQEYPRHQPPHLGRWIKGVVALLLLFALAWVAFVALQYKQTGKPISEVAGIKNIGPLAKLVQEPPRFAGSVWNVARPLGVAAAPDGSIYVTESAGDRMVRSFDANGQAKASFATTDSGAPRNPLYAAVSPSGNVYVSDLERHAVLIFAPDGQAAGQVASPSPEGWTPAALAFDAAGNLYATDLAPGQHRVVVLDPSGALLLQIGQEGSGPGQFEFPNGVAVDAQGNIYVSDSGNGRLQAFDKSGRPLFTIGRGTGKGDLGMPRGVAVDSGRKLLYVVDATAHAVNAYDISGPTPKFAFRLGEDMGGESLTYPNAVAVDGNGRIFVADKENQRIAIWKN